MGSGMPIAAVVGKADVMDAAVSGTIGGTYIGNPVCCAASLATIQLMKEINLNQKAIDLGKTITQRLKKIQQFHPKIGDVRGLGAMVAIEFVKNGDPLQPDHDLCGEIIKRCADRGLILLSAGTFKNIIRVLSPIVISDELLEKGLNILEQEIINTIKK
jgi:4-aminobutyrate aminotransferase/(S)-3-amino-2-methylpropionate transaminase